MTSTRKGEGGREDWGKGLQLIIRFVRRGAGVGYKVEGGHKIVFFIVEVINELWLQAINSFMLFNMDMPGKVDHFADIS